MKEYENYIFDLYGTLIDIHTDESKRKFWHDFRDFLSSYGPEYDIDELKDAYFAKVAALERKQSRKDHLIEIDIHDVFAYLYKYKDITVNEEIINMTAIEFRKLSTTHIRLYAHVMELFEKLRSRNKKVYLLSNAQSLFTVYELKILGIHDCFDGICISSDIGYRKPDRIFLLELLRQYKLKKENCLIIGNDLNSDILCANSCGIDSYYIKDRLSSRQNKNIHSTYYQDGMDIRKLCKNLLSSR